MYLVRPLHRLLQLVLDYPVELRLPPYHTDVGYPLIFSGCVFVELSPFFTPKRVRCVSYLAQRPLFATVGFSQKTLHTMGTLQILLAFALITFVVGADVEAFLQWYQQQFERAKFPGLELRETENGRIGVFATEDLDIQVSFVLKCRAAKLPAG